MAGTSIKARIIMTDENGKKQIKEYDTFYMIAVEEGATREIFSNADSGLMMRGEHLLRVRNDNEIANQLNAAAQEAIVK